MVAGYAREIIKERLQRIAGAQMIEQAFDWNTRAAKHRLAAESGRVFFNAFGQTTSFGLRIGCQTRCHVQRLPDRCLQDNPAVWFVLGARARLTILATSLFCWHDGKQVWLTNAITDLKTGASIHLTPTREAVFLFTDQGDLILGRLTPQGYREISRAHVFEPTTPLGTNRFVWTPPAYANGHIFARNDKELVCASLAAER